jgi:hypothetical protein
MTVQKKQILIVAMAALVPIVGLYFYMASGDDAPAGSEVAETQSGEEDAQLAPADGHSSASEGHAATKPGSATGTGAGSAATVPAPQEEKSSSGFFGFFKSKEAPIPSAPGTTGGAASPSTSSGEGSPQAAAPSGLPGEFMGKGEELEPGSVAATGPACVSVEFKSKDGSLKGKRHELVFQDSLPNKKGLCIQVDGKAVSFEVASAGTKAIVDRKILRAKTKVTAIYCKNEKECALKCPKVEEDFWDSVSTVSNEAEVTGFAASESQEEKALQKELVALSEVLKSQPEAPEYAQWVVASQRPVPCE